jgi:hypothetical protein
LSDFGGKMDLKISIGVLGSIRHRFHGFTPRKFVVFLEIAVLGASPARVWSTHLVVG